MVDTGRKETRIGPKDLFETGTILAGLYRVEASPIKGGMGLVYRVHHNDWDVDLAMKRPYASLFELNEAKAREMFESECENWISLGVHPNIVVCYYFREINGMISVFSEWMDGGSLKDWIGRPTIDPLTGRDSFQRGRLYDGDDETVVERILDIAIQTARGLHYAHERGLIHQDVKPDNILLSADGVAKVTDFGIARVKATASLSGVEPQSGTKTLSTRSGGFSKPYCSPEQAEGRIVKRRTDIWSWAVMLLEMLVVDRKWGDGTVAGYGFRRYLKSSPLPIPLGLEDLLARCFENDEANRPHDFSDIEMELLILYEIAFGHEYPRSYLEAVEDTADTLNNRALSFIDIGKSASAEDCWLRALGADHNHLESRFNYSLYCWRVGRIDDMEMLRRMGDLAQNHPGDTRVERLYAQIHLERGDRASAHACLEHALAADPNDRAAKSLLAFAQNVGEARLLRTYAGHSGTVYCLLYFDGGRRLLTSSDDNSIILWDTDTGEQRKTLIGHANTALCLDISADGKRLLSGGNDNDHDARVWDLETGVCRLRLHGHTDDIRAVALSPDGRYAVTGGVDQSIRLWDAETGACLKTYEEHKQYVCALRFLSDGKRFVSCSMDATARIWDVGHDESQCTFSLDEAWGLSLAVSSDDQTLFVGCNDATLRIFDLETGKRRRTIQVHSRNRDVSSIRASDDGTLIVTSMNDSKARFFDVASGCCVYTAPAQDKLLRRIGANGDLTRIACISGKEVREYERPRYAYRAGWIMCRVISAAERFALEERFQAIFQDAEKALKARDVRRSLELLDQARAIPGHEDDAQCLALNLRAGRFALPVSIRSVRERGELTLSERALRSVCVNADGTRVLVAGDDAHIKLYDLGKTSCLSDFAGHADKVLLARFCADESRMVSCAKDRQLKVWDASNAKELCSFKPVADGFAVLDVALNANGSIVFAAADDKKIRLFRVDTGAYITELSGHTDAVSAVCPCADGKRVLSGSWDQTVRLWDIESGAAIKTLKGHRQDVLSVCMSMDGKFALSGGYDRAMILWDVENERIVHTFADLPAPVTNVSMSVDSRYLFSAYQGGTMELWDRASMQSLRRFTGHSDGVCSCVSANGRSVVSCGKKGTMRIWDLDWVYTFDGWTDWDEAARPYLARFLQTHDNATDRELDALAETLCNNGLGHMRRDALRKGLERVKRQ